MRPATPARQRVLDVSGLTVEYRQSGRAVRAVTDLSFRVHRGETVALIGESGCGKTTAVLGILGMLPAAATLRSGEVVAHAGGKDIRLTELTPGQLRETRWRHVAYVPQGSISAFNPIQTIARHFRQTAKAHGMAPRDADDRAHELLTAVHLDADRVWSSYPHELSGGTRQRVAIALAMLLKPEVIILDEPTTALDVITQEAVMETLVELQEATGVGYLFITHDLTVATAIADVVVTMYAGRAVEMGSSDDLVDRPLHPYTRGLMLSTPSLDHDVQAKAIGGYPPNLADLPAGCAFHPRCRSATADCRTGAAPELVDVGGRRVACPVTLSAAVMSDAGQA